MKYSFEDPSKYNCKGYPLYNFGYMRATLPKALVNSLKKYCKQFDSAKPKAEKHITGLTKKYANAAPHYCLTQELKKSFLDFVGGVVYIYDKNSDYASITLKFLDKDLPFSMDDPWINVQKSIQYLPFHSHDGVYSYTCWINLPPVSLFQFMYPSSVGSIIVNDIHLTPKDEGDMIVFPAGLQHCVHPFDYTQRKRISISGNVLLTTQAQ